MNNKWEDYQCASFPPAPWHKDSYVHAVTLLLGRTQAIAYSLKNKS